jgi:hypothetical protein
MIIHLKQDNGTISDQCISNNEHCDDEIHIGYELNTSIDPFGHYACCKRTYSHMTSKSKEIVLFGRMSRKEAIQFG